MTIIPPLLRLPKRLIHLVLRLNNPLSAMCLHLALVHQGVGGGEALEARRHIRRKMPHKDQVCV